MTFEQAERALLADPGRGTPAYDRAVHAAYVRAYEARERARACGQYVDRDMGSDCATCGVAPLYHQRPEWVKRARAGHLPCKDMTYKA